MRYCIPYVHSIADEGYMILMAETDKPVVYDFSDVSCEDKETNWITTDIVGHLSCLFEAYAKERGLGLARMTPIQYPDYLLGDKVWECHYFHKDNNKPSMWIEYEECEVIDSNGTLSFHTQQVDLYNKDKSNEEFIQEIEERFRRLKLRKLLNADEKRITS